MGTVLGTNGNPMPMANVQIAGGLGVDDQLSLFHDRVYADTRAGADGEFRIVTDLTGPFYIVFTGVDHQMWQVPIILTGHDSMRMQVKLAPTKYLSPFQAVQIIYDMNRVAKGKKATMERRADGTYYVRVPATDSVVIYRILGIGGGAWGIATTASTSDSFQFQVGGDYSAVVKTKDKDVEITFDPSKLLRSSAHPDIQFEDTSLVESRLVRYFNEFLAFRNEYDESFSNHFASGGTYCDFKFDPEPMLQVIQGDLIAEKAPLLRQELSLEYADIAMLSTAAYDTAALRALVSNVPSNSPEWVYHGVLPLQVSSIMSDSETFVRSIIAESSSREYSALLLHRLCTYAERAGDEEQATSIFDRLVGEYHDTEPARSAELILRPKATVYAASSLPDFAFASVDDTTLIYTRKEFRHKFILLDFWATWCGPCVDEMKFLEKAYHTFPDSELEIVSVSFDEFRSYVRTFEDSKFRIPWKSAYVPSQKQPDAALSFNVGAFPSLILVDPSGKVVQTGDALRGYTLLKTLSKYLGTPNE